MTTNEAVTLFCAFRYALGRMTYVVDSVASEIGRRAPELTFEELGRYVAEIDEALSKGNGGMSMDVRRWEKCRSECVSEMGNRSAK